MHAATCAHLGLQVRQHAILEAERQRSKVKGEAQLVGMRERAKVAAEMEQWVAAEMAASHERVKAASQKKTAVATKLSKSSLVDRAAGAVI